MEDKAQTKRAEGTGVESILSELEELEEILTLKGVTSEEGLVRETFRVPVGEDIEVHAVIGDSSFSVANISEHGLGLFSAQDGPFSPGDRLTDLQIHYGQQGIRAAAVVRHVTPLEEGGVLCGLALEFESEQDQRFVETFVREARERFFAKR